MTCALDSFEHYGLGSYALCECDVETHHLHPLPRPEEVWQPDDWTMVYLIFGYSLVGERGADNLLYVGVSDKPRLRWENHRDEQRWWKDAICVEQRLCQSRAEAFAYESALIEALDPLYNRTGSHHRARQKWITRNRMRLPQLVDAMASRWALPV